MKIYTCALLLTTAFLSCQSHDRNDVTETPKSDSTITDETDDSLSVTTENAETNSEFLFTESYFQQAFNVRAYVIDPENEPTNLRDSPNGKIIGKLDHESDYMIYIEGQKDGWFEIREINAFDESTDPGIEHAWIHSSMVHASTRYCTEEGARIYRYPSEEENFFIENLMVEIDIQLVQLYADFAQVNYEVNGEKKSGWIHQDCLCGNPVTTCP